MEIEKIRVQEQDKQITILKRENEAVKDKLKKAEDMSKTLQNCLKELTDEKNELVDSIEELNEEKAELEEARFVCFVFYSACSFLFLKPFISYLPHLSRVHPPSVPCVTSLSFFIHSIPYPLVPYPLHP